MLKPVQDFKGPAESRCNLRCATCQTGRRIPTVFGGISAFTRVGRGPVGRPRATDWDIHTPFSISGPPKNGWRLNGITVWRLDVAGADGGPLLLPKTGSEKGAHRAFPLLSRHQIPLRQREMGEFPHLYRWSVDPMR